MSQLTPGQKRYSLRSADRGPSQPLRPQSALSSRARTQTASRPPSSRKRSSTASRREKTTKLLDLTLPLKDLRYRDLAIECKRVGLKPRGKKTDLVAMLLEQGYGGLNIKTRLFTADDRDHDHDGALSVATNATDNQEDNETKKIYQNAENTNEETSMANVDAVQQNEEKGNEVTKTHLRLSDTKSSESKHLGQSSGENVQGIPGGSKREQGPEELAIEAPSSMKVKRLRLLAPAPPYVQTNLHSQPQATESFAGASPNIRKDMYVPLISVEQREQHEPIQETAGPASLPLTPKLPAAEHQPTMSSTSFRSAKGITKDAFMAPVSPLVMNADPRLQKLEGLIRLYEAKKTTSSRKPAARFLKPPVAPVVKKMTTSEIVLDRKNNSAARSVNGPNESMSGMVQTVNPRTDSHISFEKSRIAATRLLARKVSSSPPHTFNAGSGGFSTPVFTSKPRSPTLQSPVILRNLPSPEHTLQKLLKSSPMGDSEFRQNSLPGVGMFRDRGEQRILGSKRTYSSMEQGMSKRHSWSSDVQVKSLPVGDVVNSRTLKIGRGRGWRGEQRKRSGSVGREELLRRRLRSINEDDISEPNAADKIGASIEASPFPKPQRKRERLRQLLTGKTRKR